MADILTPEEEKNFFVPNPIVRPPEETMADFEEKTLEPEVPEAPEETDGEENIEQPGDIEETNK